MSTVTVELNGERIELKGWIGTQTPSLCKSVPGGRWNPDRKVWTYPLNVSTCYALRAAFGSALRIGPELNLWAREAIAEAAHRDSLAASTSAELPNVERYAPRIADAMRNRTYQQVGAAWGARSGSFGLFDQPGLGKTVQALGALVEADGDELGRVLVLCPKVATRCVWQAEIGQWLGEDVPVYVLDGERAQREATLAEALDDSRPTVFVIGNLEMVRIVPTYQADEDGYATGRPRFQVEPSTYLSRPTKTKPAKLVQAGAEYPELFSVSWQTAIVDEADRVLIRKTGVSQQGRAGAMKLKAGRRIALTGTPLRGKAERMWGTLNWLRPDRYTSFWNWAKLYFAMESNGFSNFILGDMLGGAEDRMAADLRTVSLRRTKSEVLSELPAKAYAGTNLIPGDPGSPHAVWLTMDGPQRSVYDEFTAEAGVALEGGDLIANGHLAEATRCKQLAGSSLKVKGRGGAKTIVPTLPSVKFDWLAEKLDELGITAGEGEAKIVVASQFTSLLNLFASELTRRGVAVHLLTGQTPDKARQTMVKDFQLGLDDERSTQTRVFLLNTKAGGVAVTLDAADDLVLLDETYIPDDQEQVEDRIHRTSRIHSVTIWRLKCLDTIEEEIAWVTAAREDVTKYLMDGARGVAEARKLYEARDAA